MDMNFESPLFSFFYFFTFCLHCAACGILVPPPGIEPGPSAVRTQSPNHWTTREFLRDPFLEMRKPGTSEARWLVRSAPAGK